MKNLLTILLLLSSTWPTLCQQVIIARRRAASAPTGIAFVNYQTNSQSAGCTACTATALSVTAGNGIIACFNWQTSSSDFTNFTSPGTTWTTIGAGGLDAGSTVMLICGQAVAPSTGSLTITANVSSFTFDSTFQVAQYSGTPSSGSILDTSSTYLISNNNPACPSVTTTIANDLVLCMMIQDTGNAGNFTAGTGFTLRNVASATTGWEDKLQATTATVTPTFTSTNVGGVIMVTLAVKP